MKPSSWTFVFLLLLIFYVLAGIGWKIAELHAQTPHVTADHPSATPQTKPSKSTEPPVPVSDTAPPMSADMGIKLRDATIAQARLVIQLKDTITTYNQLQGALNAQAKTLEGLKTTALKEAKLDPEKWDVDLEKFAFVAKPEPSKPAAPAPAPKPKP